MLRYVAACVLAAALVLRAQEVTGSITGSVFDAAGSVIAGASVQLVSEQTGIVRAEMTDAQGNFLFNAVRPGTYTVTVEHAGFKQFRSWRRATTCRWDRSRSKSAP